MQFCMLDEPDRDDPFHCLRQECQIGNWSIGIHVFRIEIRLERNIGREDEFRVSGGSEFHQSRGPMTEKALLPSNDRTYGMERTSESEDRVET